MQTQGLHLDFFIATLLPEWWEKVAYILDARVITLGGTTFTIGRILYVIVLVLLLVWMTGIFKRRVIATLLERTSMDVHSRKASTTLAGYFFLLIGLMIVLQTAGIDLTTLNVLAGAVGVGIGLGLQEVANNFISGLIILFERPIKAGDRVQVGEIHGQVTDIRARSTTILTNENIAIIVPNSKFITENVINWTHNDPKIRFHVSVGVAYGSDPRLVERALIEAAHSVSAVLDEPPPGVWFKEFGDSSLQFELRAWTATLLHRKGRFVSELNFAIHDKLREHGIAIPFPQRDLHVPDRVKVVVEKADDS